MVNQPSIHTYDVLIIGSGPAGWTAAMYATRANLSTLLITGQLAGGIPGGQLMLTSEVENYPGFADGILGPELMDQMWRQALRFGATLVEEDVTRTDFSQRPLTVFTGDGATETAYRGNTVILATGASARWLGLPSEERLRGRGVSACATCDGFFFRGEEVAVVGGGDTAMEEALFLTRFATKVTVVHRRRTLRASKILQERARSNPKITWAPAREVVEILGSDRVEGLRLRGTETGVEETLPVRGVFVAIGHRPNTASFRGQVGLDDEGYVLATTHTATNAPGVFVAGDVRDRRYRQAVTAAGEGAKAALDAEEFLTGKIQTDWAATAPATEEGADAFENGANNTPGPTETQGELPARVPRIIIYTTSWCPYCRKAKRYLEERGLPYQEIDIEQTPGAAEQLERWSGGYRTVPTFDIEGRIVVGYDLAAVEEALELSTADGPLVKT
jgi:thioredoxin reductase (NADPH)